ncbi:hypothetical protein B4N89_14425 [Embleya scabrispora]|uniref:Uncharacterized protein n=1 Tax=Embleya scabrispora TaxID=159449 RepID=A0A1T3NYQ6_9ACTN|nr:hypothetical protein [Embleya scabrispora]OPC81973.1 hypothetical protein B4N89_14425 [Embleya scabrispora]
MFSEWPQACDTLPGRTAKDRADDRNRFGGGGASGPRKDPVVFRPVQIDPDTRVYVLVVTARKTDPAFDPKAYDAAGKEIKNTHL